MEELYRDPYRPVVAIHVDSSNVSLVFISSGRLLFMRRLELASSNQDWSELNTICNYLFPKVERVVLDNRPFNFLMNLYSEFKEHQWKFVFITTELLKYKFLKPLNEGAVVRFAEEWLVTSETAPELITKLKAHKWRVALCLALLCYMTFVTPNKHEISNYRPTLKDYQ